MKYSVEVETDSLVYQSPGYSGYGTPVTGYGTPTTTGRGTPSRQLTWAIEVDISKILTTPTAVREVSTVAVAACSQNCDLPSNGTSPQFQQRHRQQLPPSQVQSHPKCKISPHHRTLKSQMAAWYQIYLFAFLQHPT